jgi:hypothetical protein
MLKYTRIFPCRVDAEVYRARRVGGCTDNRDSHLWELAFFYRCQDFYAILKEAIISIPKYQMIKEIPPNLNYSFPIVAIAFTGMEYICSYIGECPRDS